MLNIISHFNLETVLLVENKVVKLYILKYINIYRDEKLAK